MRGLRVCFFAVTLLAGLGTVRGKSASAQAVPVSEPKSHSGIAGVVRDSLGAPIALARIVADVDGRAAVSDDSGRFDLRGLPSGRNGITILKIGFAAVSFEAVLPTDSVVVVAVSMRRAQTLDAVDVRARGGLRTPLARAGFEDRRRLGLGSFLTPAQVDSMVDRVLTLSHFLRAARGIDLRCDHVKVAPPGCVPVAHNISTPCLQVFLDGARVGSADELDDLPLTPYEIAAIEVYERSTVVPVEFQAPPPIKQGRGISTGSGCGAIVLWTKGWAGIETRRRPDDPAAQ